MTASPVVVDNGTGMVRCGCTGLSPLPLLRCPTVTGRATAKTVALRSFMGKTQTPSSLLPLHILNSAQHAPVLKERTGLRDREDMRLHRERPLQAGVLCGDELAAARVLGGVELTYPIRNGFIHNMDAMQEIWDYALCERLPSLARPSCGSKTRWKYEDGLAWLLDRPLLLCEQTNISLRQRCDLLELFFEKYNFPTIQPMQQGLLSLFANGADRGVVVECGEGLSHCMPVFDGFLLTTAQRSTPVAGRAVTERLAQVLGQQQPHWRYQDSGRTGAEPTALPHSPRPINDMDVLRQIKERCCYVATENDDVGDRRMRETSTLHCECVLPDGTPCRLGPERFAAPELLFDPREADYDCDGIAMTLWKSIEAAGIDVRTSFYENIFLSGGSTLLPGFGARLQREMKSLYLTEKLKGNAARMARCPIRVKEPQWRQHMVYMGGAILAEFSQSQPEMWMSRSAYEEGGTSAIIARYCASA